MYEDFQSTGGKPIAILHINVRNNCKPLKPVEVSFPIPADLLEGREAVVFQSDTGDKFEDAATYIVFDLSKKHLLMRVDHFSM